MADIYYKKEGMIGTVSISNPEKKNALTMDMLVSLKDLIEEKNEDGELRCMILRGEGEEAFCAGYDINAIPSKEDGGEQVLLSSNPFDDMIRVVENARVPLIAMINGAAFGGGLELACACDIRIASETSIFGMTPARLGVIYRPAGLMRFVSILGLPFTKELFYTARPVSALRAEEIGLVNRLVPGEELEQAVYETAREIVENAPLSIQGTKRILRMCMDCLELGGAYIEEADKLIRECIESDDLVEGKRAFREKRNPRFEGK